mmetsp:Transcript_62063/g.147901  ORF Transcript_62063/g.147901 Transcript_62063/m.147901 type:complete len:226 (+) Transcript_62063:811-1488(+)
MYCMSSRKKMAAFDCSLDILARSFTMTFAAPELASSFLLTARKAMPMVSRSSSAASGGKSLPKMSSMSSFVGGFSKLMNWMAMLSSSALRAPFPSSSKYAKSSAAVRQLHSIHFPAAVKMAIALSSAELMSSGPLVIQARCSLIHLPWKRMQCSVLPLPAFFVDFLLLPFASDFREVPTLLPLRSLAAPLQVRLLTFFSFLGLVLSALLGGGGPMAISLQPSAEL